MLVSKPPVNSNSNAPLLSQALATYLKLKGEGKDKIFVRAANRNIKYVIEVLGNLPIESHKLQAFVTEAVKPFLDHVVVYGVGGAHFYISQSDKGSLVFGGDLDWY